MRRLLTLLPALCAWSSGPALAFTWDDVRLGAPLAQVEAALSQAGLPVSVDDASGPALTVVDAGVARRLSFCGDALAGVAETIPGGIEGFLARGRAETVRHGLAVPDLALLPDGGEIVYSQWTLERGTTLAVVWAADSGQAGGSVVRTSPCPPDEARPTPGVAPVAKATQPPGAPATVPAAPPRAAAALAPASPQPAPARKTAALEPVAPPAPVRPQARTVDVVVPLPDVSGPLIVDRVAKPAEPAPAATPDAGVAAAPVPEPRARPRNLLAAVPRPAEPAAKPRRDAAPQLPAVDDSQGTEVRDRQDPEQTDAILPAPPAAAGPAVVPVPPAAVPGVAELPEPVTTAAPVNPRRKSWKPATVDECARQFRSYDRATQTYRSVSGVSQSCP